MKQTSGRGVLGAVEIVGSVAVAGVFQVWLGYQAFRAVWVLVDRGVGEAVVRRFGRYRNSADEPWRDGWGMTYEGWGGVGLAGGQGLLSVVGIGLLVWGVMKRRRLVAVGGFCLAGAHAALWAGNALYLGFAGERWGDVAIAVVGVAATARVGVWVRGVLRPAAGL